MTWPWPVILVGLIYLIQKMDSVASNHQTIPLHASYNDDYFSTRPLQLLSVKNWICNHVNNGSLVDSISKVPLMEPLHSTILGISKNDKEALQRLFAYIDLKGGPPTFKRRPVYLLSFGYALFIYATQILKQDLVAKVELDDDSWIDFVTNSLNASEFAARIIRENVPLSKSILKEWNDMASFEENVMDNKGLISLFIKEQMYTVFHFTIIIIYTSYS